MQGEDQQKINVAAYLQQRKAQGFSARCVGSLVADCHRNLLRGGICFYPAATQNPGGKLRLLHECNPLAFIGEQAGGKSPSGTRRTMEIEPQALHERCPVFIGSKELVEQVERLTSDSARAPA